MIGSECCRLTSEYLHTCDRVPVLSYQFMPIWNVVYMGCVYRGGRLITTKGWADLGHSWEWLCCCSRLGVLCYFSWHVPGCVVEVFPSRRLTLTHSDDDCVC